MVVLHPVFVIVAAGTLVCLFARALTHKVSNFEWFSATLDSLQAPAVCSCPAGVLRPDGRRGFGDCRVDRARDAAGGGHAGVGAAGDLRRGDRNQSGAGNRRIDCGCGGAGQGLSWFLVGRNMLLIGLAIVAAATPLPADLGVLAWISAICGIVSFMLLIAGAEQLNENWSWLTAADDQSYVLHPPHVHDHGEEHH